MSAWSLARAEPDLRGGHHGVARMLANKRLDQGKSLIVSCQGHPVVAQLGLDVPESLVGVGRLGPHGWVVTPLAEEVVIIIKGGLQQLLAQFMKALFLEQ